MHPARWVKRTEMQLYRSSESDKCSYSCALNQTLGKDYLKHLQELAPEIEGAALSEVVINRYDKGDYIPEHQDRTIHTYNFLIHLEDSNEEGLIIEDKFYPFREGEAVIFRGAGLKHSVPPVINTRYTLIYLYERAYV